MLSNHKPTPEILREYADRIESDLLQNILPFWLRHAPASSAPAFIAQLSNDLTVDHSAERGMLLTTRILWTFSAAYRRFLGPEYLEMAHRAYRDLQQNFHDTTHGGYVWSRHAGGAVCNDRKQTYGQAFALYALSEYFAATRRSDVLEEAVKTFQLLETMARDNVHGGYIEALSREWRPITDMRLSAVDLNAPKSQNTHLHLLEAYTALQRAWPNYRVKRALSKLAELMLTKIADPASGHLRLFFDAHWTPLSDAISYGHDIEATWLLRDAVDLLSSPTLEHQAKRWIASVAAATLERGVDTDGALFNQGSRQGVTDPRKEWWPQAEGVVGFINAAETTGDQQYLVTALRIWDFIEANLIDRKHGEWFRGVTRDGVVLSSEAKLGFWKCPYHNARAAMEASRLLRVLADSSHIHQ